MLRFAGGGALFLYNICLLFFIECSIPVARSASAVSTKRHSKESAALRLDSIWGREVVRLEGEPVGEGGLLVIQHQVCLRLYIWGGARR